MNIGKTLFAQLMDFLPWTTFTRIVERHGGNRYVKSLACTEQFRVMAFAQLTYRESLRDIEVCLSAQAAKLYHMGFRHEIKRSTLADANESRDWRIHAEFAQCLILQTRKLYIGDSFGIELENTTYALDSTTIDLCLSLFPWALFRTTKSAVKMHRLLDLRGNMPSFIHITDGKRGDVNVLDVLVLEAGAIYIMDRGYLDFTRLYVLHQAKAFFVTRAKSHLALVELKAACANCNVREICQPAGLTLEELDQLDALVDVRRRVRRGDTLYRAGEPFNALYAVRSGFFKSRITYEDGRDQFTGFSMAGEILGMDGIGQGAHNCDAVALEDSEVCAIPYEQLENLSREIGSLQRHFHKIMSREIVRESGVMMPLGAMRSEERIAAFLLNLSQRLNARGYSPLEFHLRMTREEIGSYLRLKLETVSRAFSKFHKDGLIEVEQKFVRIKSIEGLKQIYEHHVK